MTSPDAVQFELFCLDCDAPAFPRDDRCAEHSWNHDAAQAFAEIKRELADDAARAQDDLPNDGGAA